MTVLIRLITLIDTIQKTENIVQTVHEKKE